MKKETCKLLIIGAGPGGYVCGIRAGQLGIDTIIVEDAKPGGTCLNVGCIPSKALIHAADEFAKASTFAAKNTLGISVKNPAIDLSKTIAWKDGIVKKLTGGVSSLLKKAGTRYFQGRANIIDGKTVEIDTDDGPLRIVCENLVIATGSKPYELDFLPFGGPVISSTEALDLKDVPKKLAVIGAGYIGLEIGTAMAKLGAGVTIVEAAERILPQYDAELTKPVMRRLKALGITVHLTAKATGLSKDKKSLLADTSDVEISIAADTILVAVGRTPALSGFGLTELDLTMNGTFLAIDAQCRTSMRGVFAIGDVTGEPMLAHRAMAQGEMVAQIVAGNKREWDKQAMPAVCFTDPEIVSVGLSPDEARDKGYDIAVESFPLAANGRAMTTENSAGFVRVVARADNHQVLGIQATGNEISELSAAFSLALEMGAWLEDLAETIHAHPTQSEAVQEAALSALGNPLHF